MSRDMQSATPSEPPVSRFETTVGEYAHKLIVGIARHWLALFNMAWGTYLLLPFLAPVFMYMGWTGLARVIYATYSVFCHQLPDHSYFFFGQSLTPHLHELEAHGMEAGLGLLEQRLFIGNTLAGYKMAFCQRDTAIYGAVFVTGLLFNIRRHTARALNWRFYLLFLIPIAVDGLTQLVGLRDSNWWLRSITGALFGAASVAIAYPYIQAAMQDVLDDEVERYRQSVQAVEPSSV